MRNENTSPTQHGEPDPQDQLDQLLSLASRHEAPAWFEVKTLARLRRELEDQESKSFSFALFKKWLMWGIPACAAIALLAISWNHQNSSSSSGDKSHPQEKSMIAQAPSQNDFLDETVVIEEVLQTLTASANPQNNPKENTGDQQKIHEALDAFFSFTQEEEVIWLVDASL